MIHGDSVIQLEVVLINAHSNLLSVDTGPEYIFVMIPGSKKTTFATYKVTCTHRKHFR